MMPAVIVTPSRDRCPFRPAYLDTVFLVPEPPAEWPAVFAIVTAHNPDGRAAEAAVNRENELALREHLHSLGLTPFEVIGCSADLEHRETGCGFACELGAAASVSERFQQEAFFWVEGGAVFLCNDASGRGWYVACWKDRLRATR